MRRTSGSEARAGETDRPKGRHRAPARPYALSLTPNVRSTWAPRGTTPVLVHRFNWKRASIAAALCFGSDGGGCQLAFHVQPGSYNTDSLIGVLGELRRFLGGQKATVLWDGLPAHRSNKVRRSSPASATGWWWSGCPAMPWAQPDRGAVGQPQGQGRRVGLPCWRHPGGGHRGRPAWYCPVSSPAPPAVFVSSSPRTRPVVTT